MPEYRRNFVPGVTYFFTVVTHERRPILTTQIGRDALRQSLAHERSTRPFDVLAFVLLPDHLHCVWTLPIVASDFSIRWARIKEKFTRHFLRSGGEEGTSTASRDRKDERAVWQRRFWEHTCRDPDDLKRCVDYLHWNPVKHGHVGSVGEYPWSSFHRFVRGGEYDAEWGRDVASPVPIGVGWD